MGVPITKPSTIYAIRCKINGRLYIGRTHQFQKRLREHFANLRNGAKICSPTGRTNHLMQSDYKLFGEQAFEVYILEEQVPPDLCQEREAYWIEQYRSTDPRYGYNKRDEKPKIPEPKKGLPPCCNFTK